MQCMVQGRRAIRIEGDVSLEADVQALVAKTVEQLGELTVGRAHIFENDGH